MKRLTLALLAVAPFVLVPMAFVAVLRSGQGVTLRRADLPVEGRRKDRCTWHCHNRGCSHRPVLPPWLAGDAGLFGQTIRALQVAGRRLSPADPRHGYGAVNLLVFCVVWPLGMLSLYWVALWQRQRLRLRQPR